METSEGRRVVRRGAIRAASRDEAREILLRRFPHGRIAGLYPTWRDLGSGEWEYEVELQRWPDRRRHLRDPFSSLQATILLCLRFTRQRQDDTS